MKRLFDIAASATGLVLVSPVIAVVAFLVWLHDRHSPFYVAERIGVGGRPFRMVKLRSMIVNADRIGIDSTAKDDPRITAVGRFIRKTKLDEISQLWNVLVGYMSLVGPRPNVERDVRLYTDVERRLLDVRPGITDFASIVFADEGSILEGSPDPDLRYNQIIRPWKNRMGLHYLAVRSFALDVQLILATLVAAVSRRTALIWVAALLRRTGADATLVEIAMRELPLREGPPPGATDVVRSRSITV